MRVFGDKSVPKAFLEDVIRKTLTCPRSSNNRQRGKKSYKGVSHKVTRSEPQLTFTLKRKKKLLFLVLYTV
jgi:hypothetical protein